MPDNEIHVWVVEDNPFLRETLVEVLDADDAMRCTLATDSCEAALGELKNGSVPQVVLMDLGLPGMGGIEGIQRLRIASPASAIIVLTVHDENEKIFDALCAGASGYLLKPAGAADITTAVRSVLEGGAPMNAFIARRVLDMFTGVAPGPKDYGLTEREREILELLTHGHTQKQIAKALILSPHTVDTHLRNIYSKLHVHSGTGAVAKALRERLL